MPRTVPILFALTLLAALPAACNRNAGGAPGGAGAGGAGGPGGGPPPMPVETVTLAEKPLEQTSEYIASLKSRRSTTIQPQVEGFLTRIAVRSGQAVRQGAVLFEIDSGPQQAGLASLESTRAVRDAELAYAAQELERTKALYGAGAVSQRELAQAETAQRTAEAALKALDEQLRQQKTELAYYRVTSPTAGVVGDIPVRQGDRVVKTTVLTTVDENDVLELYVNVPVQQAPGLKLGLPVRIVDDRGHVLATNKITYRLTERRADANRAGQGSARGWARRLPERSTGARATRLAGGAGAERPAHGGHADQRTVLRLRCREGRRQDDRAAEGGHPRTVDRQRLRRVGRAEAG